MTPEMNLNHYQAHNIARVLQCLSEVARLLLSEFGGEIIAEEDEGEPRIVDVRDVDALGAPNTSTGRTAYVIKA